MTAWQPIETAPRDGTPLLVIEGVVQNVAVWRDGIRPGWCLKNPYSDEPFMERDGDLIDLSPTHWMPLSPPPDGAL